VEPWAKFPLPVARMPGQRPESYVVLTVIYAIAILGMVRTVRVWYNRTRIVQTIRVRYKISYHTRTVCTIRVWYVPYAYGTIYAYGIEQIQFQD